MIYQTTLNYPIGVEGRGLHKDKKMRMTLHPAPPDTGIVFRRIDVDPPVDIPARASYVSSTQLCTTLKRGGFEVSTVEHLLAAFAGFGVDNARIDVDNVEVPIMDGSAASFVTLLASAGLRQQDAPKQYIRIRKEVAVSDGDKKAAFFPYDGFHIRFSIDFGDKFPFDSKLEARVDFSTTSFVHSVCRSRTFGFGPDIEYLRSQGLAQGGSLDNAVVVDEGLIRNPEGLRASDEFVKHKILDAIGDLYLLGGGLIGGFSAHKSGHKLNNALLRALISQKDAWEKVTFDNPQDVPIHYNHSAAATYSS